MIPLLERFEVLGDENLVGLRRTLQGMNKIEF